MTYSVTVVDESDTPVSAVPVHIKYIVKVFYTGLLRFLLLIPILDVSDFCFRKEE